MKSVLFITEAGPSIGFGHLRRCLTLATALTERGLAAQFRVAGGTMAEAIATGAGFGVASIPSPGDPKEVAEAVSQSGADCVVLDSYAATADVFKSTGIPTVIIDDLADREMPAAIVINSAIRAGQLGYPRLTAARLLLGPEYALLRREFREARLETIRSDITRIIVTLGGGNHGPLVSDISSWCASQLPHATIEVVLGPFSPVPTVNHVEGLTLLRQPDMTNLMSRADLAIAAGGQTLFELAAVGLPALVVEMAANQRQNIDDFAAFGTVRDIGKHDDRGLPQRFATAMDQLRSASVREDMSQRGPDLVDGCGAERVAFAIQTLLESGIGSLEWIQ